MQPMSVTLPLELFRLPPKAPPCSSAPAAVPAAAAAVPAIAVAAPEGPAAVTAPAAAAGPGANGDTSDITDGKGHLHCATAFHERTQQVNVRSSLSNGDSIASSLNVQD